MANESATRQGESDPATKAREISPRAPKGKRSKVILYREWLCTSCGRVWEYVRGGVKPRCGVCQ